MGTGSPKLNCKYSKINNKDINNNRIIETNNLILLDMYICISCCK